eukprot:scaffold103498_cov67-Phaeocystis_antarctica.AAC.2
MRRRSQIPTGKKSPMSGFPPKPRARPRQCKQTLSYLPGREAVTDCRTGNIERSLQHGYFSCSESKVTRSRLVRCGQLDSKRWSNVAPGRRPKPFIITVPNPPGVIRRRAPPARGRAAGRASTPSVPCDLYAWADEFPRATRRRASRARIATAAS